MCVTSTCKVLSILAVSGAMFAGRASAQGSLTPPAGAPAPTMRTLQQVEPRTPIAALPFTITAPGAYYLTTNLTSSGGGISIDADGVTLDLMGFTLSGNNGGGYYGVALGAGGVPVNNGVVRNGYIRNFGDGLLISACQSVRVEQITLYSNKNSGIMLSASSSKECANNVIRDCMIDGNGSFGGVLIYGNGGFCRGNTFADCIVVGNNGTGIYLNGYSGGACNGNIIRNCTINDNVSYGIYLTSGAGGQCEGNLLADCTLSRNGSRGIWMSSANGNRVEGNHLYGQLGANTYGIESSGASRNLIFRNSCVGQTNNFSLSSSDTYGPIVTVSGALSTTNGAAGLSPWANFSR
jgi:parallel beta-helix repeat protein